MSSVLNPRLYCGLQRAFKHVAISHAGVPAQIIHRPDFYSKKGRLKAQIIEYGETYRVSCPFCTDTTQRLYINHLWGVKDKETGSDMLFLAKCYNEDCLNNRETQEELFDKIFPLGAPIIPIRVAPKPEPVFAPAVKIELPPSRPVSKLSANHPAMRYLRDREFDPKVLARKWDVRYCAHCLTSRPRIDEPRLIIPIYQPQSSVLDIRPDLPEKLVGWQGRLIDPASDAPKYMTSYGMRRNEVLYGLGQAITSERQIVVVVEGVTDAWRIGSGAVALFGKSISPFQSKLLVRSFPNRPVVVLLDKDAEKQAKDVQDSIAQLRNEVGDGAAVVLCKLPRGVSDPADHDRKSLWTMIRKALKSFGSKHQK